MGKNKSRGPFYFFMVDFKKGSSSTFASLKEVADAAGPHWQQMDIEQRKPYQERAQAYKQEQKLYKLTSIGVPIVAMQKREESILTKIQKMKNDIEVIINSAIENASIEKQNFILIHVNHYGFCTTSQQYIPTELAATRFTLKNGVTPKNVYHAIIKPGPLPLGYAYQAITISNKSHQIKPQFSEEAENNLYQVATEFMAFMTEFKNCNRDLLPVYAEENNKDVVENVLKNLYLYFVQKCNYIKVYPVEYLFFTLRNAVGRQPVYPSIPFCKMELEKDKYDFCRDIPCSYHVASDVPNHCSRSRVIRLAYIICDNCCGDLGIELTPGRHVPSNAKIICKPRRCSSTSGYDISSSRFSTFLKAPHGKNPSRYNSKAHDYFLSQRSESGMSALSEISSMCDPNDYTAVGACAYDSDYRQTDTEEWIEPSLKRQHNENIQVMSQISLSSNQPTAELHFTFTSADESSRPTFSRRPAQHSVSLVGRLSQMSVSSNEPTANLQFTSQSADESSRPIFNRRPYTLSAALTGISRLSISPSPGRSPIILPVGDGRGRGPITNHVNKIT